MKIKTPDAVGPGSRGHTLAVFVFYSIVRDVGQARRGEQEGGRLFVILLLLLAL
jgi:hypothetical protein